VTATNRLRMIEQVSAKLRIIHRRCSTNLPRRAITNPVKVMPSHSRGHQDAADLDHGPKRRVGCGDQAGQSARQHSGQKTYVRPMRR